MWLPFIVGIAIPLLITIVIASSRQSRDCTAELKPLVEAAGFEWVRCENPGAFKVGPFPKFEVVVGRPQTNILGIRGEYTVYSIVTIRDSLGRDREVWAKLEFECFKFHHAEWKPDLNELQREIAKQCDSAF